MQYQLNYDQFSAYFDGAHSTLIEELDDLFDEMIKKLAETDCLNAWNGKEYVQSSADSLAIAGMPENSRLLLQSIGKRDGRGYESALELYVHTWEIVQSYFAELY